MQTVLPVEVALLSAFVQCYSSVALGFVEQTADISCLLFSSFQCTFAGPEWFLQKSQIQKPA